MDMASEKPIFEDELGPTLTRYFGCGWKVQGFEPNTYDNPGVQHFWEGWMAAKAHAAGRRRLQVHIKKRPLARHEFGVYWGPTFHKRLAAFHTREECYAWAANNGYEVAP